MAVVFGYWVYDLFALCAAVLGIAYAYFRYSYGHFKKRGIPVPLEPSFPSGNFPGVSWSQTMIEAAADVYKKTPNEKIVGCYMLQRPILLVRDMEIVKNILVKDFSNFHDRGMEIDLKREPLAGHLFLMKGQEWRNLRARLTPTFTSGKMKMMFPTLIDVGKELQKIFEESTDEVEVKELLSRYTVDVISSVAFGIETNSLKNPDAEFLKMGKAISTPTLKQILMNLILMVSPTLAKILPLKLIPQEMTDFFIGVVKETMDFRKQNNVKRNDFMQLLLQLKEQGYVKDIDNPEKDVLDVEHQQKFTIEQAAAQAFIFLFAGFETSSSTIQFAMYEMALNPELQTKLQKEVDDNIKKHNNQISYEAVMEMDLLDRIVDETLRKYPVAGVMIRECNKEYKVPGTEYTILPKDNIWFPVYGFHHDPKYYPEPEKFDPDRFLPEVKASRPHYAYLPFGEGPRNCIGNRFALMQVKAGLALIFSKFNVSPSKRTPIPMVFNPKIGLLTPLGKMYLQINKRS